MSGDDRVIDSNAPAHRGNDGSSPLAPYAHNEFSQNGEDGILARLFELLGVQDDAAWCVEFGAWDGTHLSNTFRLVQKVGWHAVLIEADPDRFRDLQDTMRPFPLVTCLNRMVAFAPPDDLDGLLAGTDIPEDFDLLSIDIDGNDYHVWAALDRYQPKVVVVEYNPTIPAHVEFVQPQEMRVHQGNSLLALKNLGARKGYELVAITDTNAIFLRAELYPLTGITDNSLDALWIHRPYQTSMFQLYDGTLVLDGCTRLVWHDMAFRNDALQLLPSALRECPVYFSPRQELAWRVWRKGHALRESPATRTTADRLLKKVGSWLRGR